MERVARLKRDGVIRRIGGNFHSSRLNFASTLCAAKVPPEAVTCPVLVVAGSEDAAEQWRDDLQAIADLLDENGPE